MVVALPHRSEPIEDALTPADRVVQLREWGTDRSIALPADATNGPVELRLQGSRSDASTTRLCVFPDRGRWAIRKPASQRELDPDEIVIAAGSEIDANGTCLVADSPRSIAWRSELQRLLGWTDGEQGAVEIALRSLRLWAERHVALVLHGDDDLIAIARSLHELVRGARRPLVVCDRRRRPGMARAHEPLNCSDATEAMRAARGGTLCVLARRLPSDFARVRVHLEQPQAAVALVVCGTPPRSLRDLASASIRIPRVSARTEEIDRIVECHAEAVAIELSVTLGLTESDREWIRTRSAASLAEIATGTRRLVALRATGSVSRAAALLGMHHASLGEWLARRRSGS